ncbi:MAG TPA: hypothetical protein PK228_08575, partial [Saprospiraceae bacterium]|nr:hypothetical protein [Saprospiraceae bacterium]
MPLPYSPDDNVFSLGSPGNLKLGVWNRLEPRPRKRDFSQVLSAPTADALWMLTRQWQMGEFKGEDASTAITTRLEIQSRPVARVGVNGHIEAFNNEVPLEARVEAEPVPFDLKMHLQVSAYWRKLLKIQNAPKEVFSAYQQLFPLEKPGPAAATQGANVLFADRLNNKSMELADLEGNFHNKS